MVSVNRRRVKGGFSLRTRKAYDKVKVGIAAGIVVGVTFVGWNVMVLWNRQAGSAKSGQFLSEEARRERRLKHPDLRVDGPDSERFNAIAKDIIRVLDCPALFNSTKLPHRDEDSDPFPPFTSKRRRLEDGGQRLRDFQEFRDDMARDEYSFFPEPPTAAHLFCMAAYSPIDPEKDREAWYWKDRIYCDATDSKRRTLLELWSAARAEFSNTALLHQVLKTTIEAERILLRDPPYKHLWLPSYDAGIEYIFNTLSNPKKDADEGGIYGLAHNLGPGKLFVDVGSCLGLTSLAVSFLYPGTKIISIEPAPPNWLVQQINWRCQHDATTPEPIILLAGVGPVSDGPQFTPVRWRHNATSSVRGWSRPKEASPDDFEFNIKLTPWHLLLKEAGVTSSSEIDVMNVDCEGCEYNFIPALSDQEFESISTVMGDVHWGYIPKSKKPSSQRAKQTHRRLCVHENFAKTAKECCAFPDLPVKSSVPGNILVVEDENKRGAFPYVSGTVKDVAGNLCNDFETWKVKNDLDNIDSDWGWFQFTSLAQDDS